jgi:hypothetical protein
VLGLSEVGIQNAQAADKNRHLRGGQRQQLRPIKRISSAETAYFFFW